MRDRRRIGVALLLFGVLVAFFAVTYSSRNITDTDLNSLQTRALALHGDADVARYNPDPLGLWVSWRGHKYSIYGVGVSLPALPIYAILARTDLSDKALQAAASIPFVAAAVVLMYLLLLRVGSRPVAAGGTVVFAFGTTMWPVAAMAFYQNAGTALFQVLGLMGFLSSKRRGPELAGFGFAAATFVRPLAAVALGFGGLYYLIRDRRALMRYIAGAALPILGIVIQNRWLWGGWLTGGYSHNIAGFRGNVPHALWALLFGFWRGMFVYSPILIVGFIGFGMALRNWKEEFESKLVVLGAIVIATVLLYARFSTWHGGLNQFGYRYLLDAIPFLIVLGAVAAERSARIRTYGMALAVISILTTTFGAAPNEFGWDGTFFATRFVDTSAGQAWIAALDRPVASVLRLVGVGLVALIIYRCGSALAPQAPDDPSPSPA